MGSFDFAVQLRRSALYVSVPDTEVFDVPMELALELVTVVSPNFSNAEWKFFYDVVDEVDGVCLRVFLIDFEREPWSRRRSLYIGTGEPFLHFFL